MREFFGPEARRTRMAQLDHGAQIIQDRLPHSRDEIERVWMEFRAERRKFLIEVKHETKLPTTMCPYLAVGVRANSSLGAHHAVWKRSSLGITRCGWPRLSRQP